MSKIKLYQKPNKEKKIPHLSHNSSPELIVLEIFSMKWHELKTQ